MKATTIALLAMCALCVGCSADSESETQPSTYDIVGLWKEYAYLTSGGYYVDITASGYADYYQFDDDGTFCNWSAYDDEEPGSKTLGAWKYSSVSDVVLVTQENGRSWNITLRWSSVDSATLDIVKSGGYDASVKCKRVK